MFIPSLSFFLIVSLDILTLHFNNHFWICLEIFFCIIFFFVFFFFMITFMVCENKLVSSFLFRSCSFYGSDQTSRDAKQFGFSPMFFVFFYWFPLPLRIVTTLALFFKFKKKEKKKNYPSYIMPYQAQYGKPSGPGPE